MLKGLDFELRHILETIENAVGDVKGMRILKRISVLGLGVQYQS